VRFALERLSDPSIEPVTLTQAKLHLREDDDAHDDEITALITGAREWAEDFTGRALVDQMWRLTIANDAWTPIVPLAPVSVCGYWDWRGEIWLRRSPVLAVVSFSSVGTDGAETEIDAAGYEIRGALSKFPRLVALSGATWPAYIGNVEHRITFRAGFADMTGSPTGSAADVPERYKQAMKLWIEANYDRDDKMMALLLDTAERLIRGERAEMSLA